MIRYLAMKYSNVSNIFVIFFLLFFSVLVYGQEGPGGVGNATGTSGQPKNILWLIADSLDLGDGANLTTWSDLSGNSNDLTQSTAAFTPIFQDDESNINGHPRAEFSKANNRIIINPFTDMPTSGITTFIIYKTSDSGDGLVSYNTTSRDNAFLIFDNSSLRTYINGSNNNSGDAFDSGNWQIMSHKWKSSGGDLIINQDGDQVHSTNFQNGVSIPAGGCLAIGGEQDAVDGGYDAGQAFQGEIAEIVMYNSFLNSVQRLLVENYLSEKYAIAFQAGGNDKYTGHRPAFVHQIAGIGQEADGDHTQTVSGGLYLYERNTTLANSEYVMLGHMNQANSSTTIRTDAKITNCGADASWAREWYLKKTSSDGIDVKLIFDFKEALSDGEYPANVSNYTLLYRADTTNDYSEVTVASQGIVDADQMSFDVANANFADGYYTIGTNDQSNSPVQGSAARTWYALASGDWDNPDYWTLDPSGSLPNNPNNEIPASSDKVVIHTGKTITLSSNTKTTASITVEGILDLGTTSGHNFTEINGNGRIRLASDNFPAGDATHFVTAGQGEGTVVWQGGTYSLATAKEFFNMEVDLTAGNTLTMLADYTLNGNLVVETGTFKINDNSATTNLTLSVTGNVSVETNGQILTGTADARHQFNMYGDFTNVGTVKFTNRTLPLVSGYYTAEATNGIVDANFLSGNANQAITCNGVSNFYRIEIDKGTDMTYELSITANNTDNFKLFGYAGQAHSNTAQLGTNANALGLIKGTVRIKNNVEIPHLNRSGNYNISEAARLWVDGGTVSASVSNAIVPYGEAKITAGTFEALVPQGFTLRENGAVIVEGGILNANQIRTSVLGSSHVGSYIQSGGTANLKGTNTNTDYYVFNLTFPENVFQMTGGTLYIEESHGRGGIFINSDPANVNVTDGTVICDIDDTQDFIITSRAPFWNVILRNTTAGGNDHILDEGVDVGATDVNLAAQPLVVLNDLTIEAEVDTFITNNNNVSIGRNFSIQEGATYNYGTNTTTFNGTEDGELYIGHSIDDGYEQLFYNLTIDKAIGSTLLLTGDSEKEAANVSKLWRCRLIQVTNNFIHKSGTFDQGKHSVRLFGTVDIRKDGIFTVYEDGVTATNATAVFRGDGLTIQTEEGAQIGNFKMDVTTPATHEIAFTSDVYILRMAYKDGKINMGTNNIKIDYLHDGYTTNTLQIDDSDISSSGGAFYSAGNASDGGLSLFVTGNGTYGFPIGVSGKYTPAEMTISNYADDGYVTINPVDKVLQTTDLSGGDILSYYWRVGHEDFTTEPTVQHKFTYDISDDDSGNDDTFYPGKVLDGNGYTRSYEANFSKVDDDSEGGNYTITFNDAGSGFTLENANYTAGEANRFGGAPEIFYTFRPGDGFHKKWDDGNNWTYGDNAIYDPHDSRQTAADDYPQAGDIAIIGWVPHGDPGGTDGDPHGIAVNNIAVDFAEIKFSQMEDADGNPTARQYAYNFQFRPTVVINNAGGALNGSKVSGEGLFWMRWGGSQADPDFSAVDIGDFVSQDSSYFVYESKSGVYNNVPAELPNLLIAGDGWGANDQDFELATDIKINANFELLGDINLILSSGATGDVIVENDLRIFRSNANGNESGGFGRIDYPNDASRSIEVFGDVKLENEQAIIRVANPNTTVNESYLTLHGNIIQDNTTGGGLQLYSAANEDYVKLSLQGSGNNYYSLASGAIANFYNIEFNKGSDTTSTFTFEDNFILNGPTSGAGVDKALELQNGKLILNNPAINVDLTTGDDDFEIPETACLEVRQGTANANGGSGIFLDGKLQISGGTVDMSGGNNYIEYSASGNATIEISAGTLTVGSQIRRGLSSSEGILNYTQSGGTVIVGRNAAPEGNRAVFEILNTGSSFTHSAGDLQIVRQQTNPTFATLYLDPETSSLSSGATIYLGDANTQASQEFGIYSTINLQNLTIDNTSTNDPVAKMWTVPLSIDDILLIQANSEFDANGLNLNLYGDIIQATNGVFTASQNTTYFKAALDQEINGDITFYNVTNQNTSNLNLTVASSDITIDNIFINESGATINDNNNDIYVAGDIDMSGTHVYGGSGDGITLNGSSQQEMTGSGTFGKLTINNATGINVPVGNELTVNNYLKLRSGVLDVGGNLLTLNTNCIIQEANPFGPNNMIQTNVSFTDNGVKKIYSSGAINFTYPIGSVGKYTPVEITTTTNTASDAYLIAKAANEIHPSIIDDSEGTDPDIVDADNVLQYYWVLTANGFTDLEATIEMGYDTADVEVTAPYDVYDYITAKLLNDGTGNWLKYDDVSKFDEAGTKLIFDISSPSDLDITGDYTAGVDGSTFEGAIPDQVPLYQSNGTGALLDWNTASTWRVDDGMGSWVLPSTQGLPDIPRGARVRILLDDTVQTDANYILAYTAEINGTLDVGTTFGNRVGEVSGTGTLYTEKGNLPAGYYPDFFSASGGTIEFGGSADYSVLSNITQVNNLTFSGTGLRELPNLELTILGDMLFSNVGTSAPDVVNEFDQDLLIGGNITFNSGTYDAGIAASLVKMNGTSAQTINGSSTFIGTDAFWNFELDNSAGITLSTPVDVDNNLTFTNGIMTTDAANILTIENLSTTAVTGYNSSNYVDGPMLKNVNSGADFLFPVGDGGRYGPVHIYNTTNSSSAYWKAQYFNKGYSSNSITGSLAAVSEDEYWEITNPTAGDAAEVEIRWDSNSELTPLSTGDINDIVVAEFNGTKWQEKTSDAPSGDNYDGTVKTTNAINTNPMYYTLGSVTTILAKAYFTTTDDVCAGTGIPVSFSGVSDTEFNYELVYTYEGTEQPAKNITSSDLPYSLPTDHGQGEYKLKEFTYNTLNTPLSGKTDGSVVTANGLPTASATVAADPICEGESTTLDATGSSRTGTLTYSWDNPTTLNDPTSATPIASPTTTTTYTVTVTDGNNCAADASVVVNVNPQPTISNFTGENPACALESGVNTYEVDDNGDSYSWSLDPAGTGTINSPNSASTTIDWDQVTTAPSRTVQVIITADDGTCVATESLEITVLRSPVTGNQYYIPNEFDQ